MTVLCGSNSPALRTLFADDTAERVHSRNQSSIDSRTMFDPHWDSVPPLWSGGQSDGPDYALVFINPTARNQAAREGWPDEYRAPHIGFRRMWAFFVSCGLLPDTVSGSPPTLGEPPEEPDDGDIPCSASGGSPPVLDVLPPDRAWTSDDAARVYQLAAEAGIYVTNLVKACGVTGKMPSAQFAREYLGLLVAELNIIRPRYIITMGGLVTSLLYGRPVRMKDMDWYLTTTGRPFILVQKAVSSQMILDSHGGAAAAIVPSYFPGGRGEPAKARAIISALTSCVTANRTDRLHDHGPELNCQACYYGEPSQWSDEGTAAQEES